MRKLVAHAKVWVAEGEVGDGLLAVVSTTVAGTIHLLALKLVLNALAIGRIANEREDRSDAFH